MKLPVTFRAEAETEFRQACDYYDAERPGYTNRFIIAIRSVLGRIAETPELYSIVMADIRRATVRRFPYSVFYRTHLQSIEVIAVFHHSRDPQLWQERG